MSGISRVVNLGGVQGPAGAVGAPGVSPFINIRDYGASGTGVTNDSAAMASARAAAAATGRGLYLPAGRYLCSGLTVTNNTAPALHIRGDGQFKSTIVVNTAGGPGFANPGGNFICFAGLGLLNASSAGPALLLEQGANASIQTAIYGSGNAGQGVKVARGAKAVVFSGNTPTLAATGQELVLGNDKTTALPDITASAGAVLPAASALTTWAQWAAAPFSRRVCDYADGAAITTT